MVREIAPATLRHLIERGSTLALLDVREPGEYNTAHIPGASLLPRRQIEFRLERLVPARGVPCACAGWLAVVIAGVDRFPERR